MFHVKILIYKNLECFQMIRYPDQVWIQVYTCLVHLIWLLPVPAHYNNWRFIPATDPYIYRVYTIIHNKTISIRLPSL